MNLLTESLWGDESFSAIAVQKNLLNMMSVVMKDTSPPLFYLVGFVWGRIFGFSEVALRSLTLTLMLLTAIFAGLIVHQISKNKIESLLTVCVTFLTPFLIPFAFEWRMYALLAFTLTASTYFFIAKKWGWYVIFSLAALYTHHFAFFTIFCQGVWFLLTEFKWRNRKVWWKQLKPFILVGLGYSFWLYPFYIQLKRVQGSGFWLSVPKFPDLVGLIFRFTGFGAFLLLVKGWGKVWKDWLGLLLIFFGPVFLSFVLSYFITPIFYDRYLLSAAVGGSILLIVGVKPKYLPLALIILAIYAGSSYLIFTHPVKRPFRELASFVKLQLTSGDSLINYNGRAHHLWESKYYGIGAPIYVPGDPLPLYVGTALMEKGDTIGLLPEVSGRLGVIASEPVDKIELTGFKLSEAKQFGELSFSWWLKIK